MEPNRAIQTSAALNPRFDRLVTLVILVLLGMAVVFLIDINPDIIQARLGADLPVITVSWLLIAALVLLTALGAEILVRPHPELRGRVLPVVGLGRVRFEIVPSLWILPSLAVVASFAFFRLYSAALAAGAFVIALVVGGALLTGALVAQYYALDRRPEYARPARLALRLIALFLGFALFSAVAYARLRTLYSAALVGGTGTLLALALLNWTPQPRNTLLAALVGLVLAEATWALNYWAAPFVLSGALLLVLFYIATGLLQHEAEDALNGRVLWEYGLLGGGLFVAVVLATLR